MTADHLAATAGRYGQLTVAPSRSSHAVKQSPASPSISPPAKMSTALAKRQNTTTLAARQQTQAPDDDVASASLRSGALLCDAMGYQESVDPAAEQAAQQLVEEELRQNPGAPPRLLPLRPPRDTSVMAAEFSRCDRDEDLAPLAIERYSCAPPTEQDPEAWRTARQNVRALFHASGSCSVGGAQE